MYDLLVYIHKTWTESAKVPIWITENGISVSEPTLYESQHDTKRIEYMKDYLAYIEKAIDEQKVNVKAYFVWSLLDNFEWWSGFSKRFGLTRVEYTIPPTRHEKASLKWYAEFIKSHTTSTNKQ